jgi:hypothetical protein
MYILFVVKMVTFMSSQEHIVIIITTINVDKFINPLIIFVNLNNHSCIKVKITNKDIAKITILSYIIC